MKVMYVTVGAPGSGKTLTVDSGPLGSLDNIHSDRVRDLVEGYTTKVNNETGSIYRTHDTQYEKETWEIIWNLIEQRMQRGKTFCFDSTFLSKGSFSTLKKLREKYGYRVYALDFTKVPLETLNENNQTLHRIINNAVVPDEVLLNMHNRAKNVNFPSWLNVIDCTDYNEAVRNIGESLTWEITEANKYAQIKIIGDIHGCASVLKENVLDDIQSDTLYVFLGDYLDRGLENVETFKLLYEHINDSNFVFLRGNHDRHLEKFVQGREIPNKQTKEETIPSLLDAGIKAKDIRRFTRKLQDLFVFEYGGKTYICTHAGLTVEDALQIMNGNGVKIDQFNLVDGVGKFNYDADYWYDYAVEDFMEEYEGIFLENATQFHGHRNTFNTDINDYSTIYNLEQRVERGGGLAVAIVDIDGVSTALYKNDNFDIRYLESDLSTDISKLDNKGIKSILDHSANIATKEVEDNLYANNFTRKVFSKGNFNNFSIQARGLFTNDEGDVKARGFKKFFNINQVPETEEQEVLKHPLPARVSEKIDGFLAILTGIDGELKVLSKGGAKNFGKEGKRILKNNASKTEEELAYYLESNNLSITCEVVSHKDSHVIEYPEENIYVLDAIYNEYTEDANFEVAKEFSTYSGLAMPRYQYVDSKEELKLFIEKEKNNMSPNFEGSVLTFADGFRVKIKTHHYFQMKFLLNEIGKKRKFSDYVFYNDRDYVSENEASKINKILQRVHFGDDYKKTQMGFEDNKATKERYGIKDVW
ncbi:MAG: metallophosphoesterase [Atopostipes suicloacalis]|nr:metallophosphoesterase [Atopostipes suicloacalis]